MTRKTKSNIITKPIIFSIDNFLSDAECLEIISVSENKKDLFKPSGTTTGNIKQYGPGRTSCSLSFKIGECQIIDFVRDKVSNILNINKNQMEAIQLTKYSKGQEYKYHWDYFKDDNVNQRKKTILIYLNSLSIDDGGATKFYYGDSFQPKQGLLLWWDNIDDNGKKHINTLHAGRPVTSNTPKYILTIWVRHKSF